MHQMGEMVQTSNITMLANAMLRENGGNADAVGAEFIKHRGDADGGAAWLAEKMNEHNIVKNSVTGMSFTSSPVNPDTSDMGKTFEQKVEELKNNTPEIGSLGVEQRDKVIEGKELNAAIVNNNKVAPPPLQTTIEGATDLTVGQTGRNIKKAID